MGLSRLGNIALYNSTLSDITNTQRRLATLQEQISSGNRADNFAGLNGQVEQFTQLEAKVRSSQQYIESNQLNISRMKTADQSMSQMIDIVDSMKNLIVLASNSATGTSANLPQVMRGYLDQLAAAMNINFDGRYLFGGSNTLQPPVPDAQVSPVSPGLPDAGYYAGSTTSLVYSQDERITYEFPVRGDDIAFQKIISAAHQAISGASAGSIGMLQSSLELIQSGQEDLNTARTRLNNTIISVSDHNDSLGALKLYWQGVTEQVSKTDIVAASTEVANHEAMLQAAFQVFARLSQLRLSDFLR
jgi:flagellar hook-associated protein 3 FlgL